MLRFGVLSTASIGVKHVLPAIQQSRLARITAVASREAKKAKKLAASIGAAHAFGSYEELLASDEVDAVYIPLPTAHHVEWTLKAAAAGKHVLCEKPIALKATDIKKLIRAQENHGVVISEAFMVTYHPQWLKVKELVSKGRIGELQHVQGVFSYYNTDASNMRNRPELGGGALPDIGVYPTVVTRFVTELEPLRVQASVIIDETFGTDRYASIKADFKTFELSFYVSTQMALRQNMVFHGTKGFIEVNAPFNSNLYEGSTVALHNDSHSEARRFNFVGINQYTLQADAFARAVRARSEELFSLTDSYSNQRVIDAVYASGKSGGTWKKV